MKIRRADIAEEEALARVRRAAILGVSQGFSREEVEAWADRPGPDRMSRAIREHEVWVAVEEVAMGWVEIERDRVAGLYVAASFGRRGVGSALLDFAEAEIRRAGHAVARLEASPNAVTFYLDRGYVHDGAQLPDNSWPRRKGFDGSE